MKAIHIPLSRLIEALQLAPPDTDVVVTRTNDRMLTIVVQCTDPLEAPLRLRERLAPPEEGADG